MGRGLERGGTKEEEGVFWVLVWDWFGRGRRVLGDGAKLGI